MGFFRATLIGVLGLGFLAAVGNVAYLTLTAEPEQQTEAKPDPILPVAVTDALVAVVSRNAAPAVSDLPPPPAPPPGPTAEQIAAVERVWRDWMAENDLTEGAMALALPDGRVIGAGIGRDPAATAPVASLSKAITGLCLDTLLQDRGLGWSTRLADIAPEMSAAGVTPRPWNETITLAGLVTHTAGLQPDLTQGDMMGRTHGALGLHRRISSEALAQDAIRGTPGQYFYSNTNYAVLGVAIEALSGRSYSETCLERVIAPAGVTGAVIEGRMGSMSSYAGWEISAEDYARLARHWFTAGQAHVDAPAGFPLAGDYAMGYAVHGSGAAAEVSHNGRLCTDRTTREGHGASFVAFGEGTAFAANWRACVEPALYDDLTDRIRAELR